MRRGSVAPVLAIGAAVAAASCSLMLDSDAVSRRAVAGAAGSSDGSGDAGASGAAACQMGEKLCEIDGERGCFPVDDPALGCVDDGCEPCDLAHAIATCGFRGPCRIEECDDWFRNCDGEHETGCEVDIRTSVMHCGGCDRPCDGSCVNGSCFVGAGGATP
jgi:hypothetical protein